MDNSHPSPGSSSLQEIDVTVELARRSTRPPDHAAENRALVELARQMAETPHSILQKLAETALELCRADSAGISILETDNGKSIFRWHATAGDFKPYLGGTTPGDFSPCGVVLDRNAPQLMADPVRYYPYIADLSPTSPNCYSSRSIAAIPPSVRSGSSPATRPSTSMPKIPAS